jgi:23S rRNA pseudouridine2457 synthase
MSKLILFNKPYGVLSQFTDSSNSKNTEKRKTLKDFISIPDVYPAGRLDYDSEGLLLLTSDGKLQHQIANPRYKLEKTYWVQVEGCIDQKAITLLKQGVLLKDGKTLPAKASIISQPDLPSRIPPIRSRHSCPTSWIMLSIKEGKNRQVRRMTAAAGYPTLRLFRVQIGPWKIGHLSSGDFEIINVNLPKKNKHPNSKK